MRKLNTLILIDLNNLIYRFPYTLPNLYFQKTYTGGIYGFLKSFASFVNKLKPSRIIVTDDAPPYKRKLVFSSYKEDRVKDFNVMGKISVTRDICYSFFRQIGIPVLRSNGYEADDIIADLVNRLNGSFKEVVIISNDKDLYQLFKHDNVVFYVKSVIYGYRQFKKQYPELIELPEAWLFYQVLTGGHNGLPKIPGIGDKKARQIVKDGTILKHFPNKKKLRELLELLQLPYKHNEQCILNENHNEIVSREMTNPSFKYSSYTMTDFMGRYGIKTDRLMNEAFVYLDKIGKR